MDEGTNRALHAALPSKQFYDKGREALASGRECGPAAQRRLRVVKARAETISLKEEVERMEERLRVGRLMQACRQEG